MLLVKFGEKELGNLPQIVSSAEDIHGELAWLKWKTRRRHRGRCAGNRMGRAQHAVDEKHFADENCKPTLKDARMVLIRSTKYDYGRPATTAASRNQCQVMTEPALCTSCSMPDRVCEMRTMSLLIYGNFFPQFISFLANESEI